MKTICRTIAAALLITGSTMVHARDINVGVSIAGEFQPGVYGQVNINTMPGYSLMYPQPAVIVSQPVYAVPVQPVYMHVPVAHAHHWSAHCGYYNACSRPVYFVKPQHYHKHGHHKHGHNHGHGHRH